MIRYPAVSNNWGPMKPIYAIKAQGSNYFRVHLVLYQLENSKLWREFAAILDLC